MLYINERKKIGGDIRRYFSIAMLSVKGRGDVGAKMMPGEAVEY
jgi:hypothetical protein